MPAGSDEDAYWLEPATDDDDAAASATGHRRDRDLLQMRVALPLPPDVGEVGRRIATRPFDAAHDEGAWLGVNNRAFHWHPDQGDRTLEDLRALEREPWFDTDDFLVVDGDPGALAGFCWTKVHRGSAPPMGEIFVIAVDPDHAGHGLGRALTVAGLDHLHDRHGLAVGMLYVEADNAAAVGLYRSLGFVVHQHRRHYVR